MSDPAIDWQGNLDDDCTAKWRNLTLRAESMDDQHWWWCVYDDKTGEQIDSSNGLFAPNCGSGNEARAAAEQSARSYAGFGTDT